MALLSKSKYLIGLQCPKYLWTLLHEPHKIPEVDEVTKSRFEQGYLIGELAKKRFADGINIPTEDFNENLIQTNNLLKKGKPLFEAGIKAKFNKGNEIYSRADILFPVKSNRWDIIEVKSTTKVKPEHISDVSFQKYVYEKAGLIIKKCFLMCVDNGYVKEGNINPKKILKIIEITKQVEEEIENIDKRIKNIFRTINSWKCPKISIGQRCKKPYKCPLTSVSAGIGAGAGCWDFLPSESVFELYYGGTQCFELLEKDIRLLRDIPREFKLTREQQKIQIQCARTGKPHINKRKIKEFLDKLEYPLYYLDFETISTAIPIFDNSHPYQQIPFQFSLHITKKLEDNSQYATHTSHVSFLAKGDKDPRPEFIKALKENLGENKGNEGNSGNKGSIIVYSESFEKDVLKKLAQFFPKEKEWIEKTTARIVDLLKPFRNFDYYNPKQKGSAGLKAVLPAIIKRLPEGIKAYSKMDISKGNEASLAFLKIALGEQEDYPNIPRISASEQEKMRQALEEYCRLDTLAEVLIVEELGKVVGN